MAQTTTYISWNAKLEFSSNGSAWTDVSGSTTDVNDSGGDIASNKIFTNNTATPIVGYGRKDEHKITANIVYTKTAGEAWALLKAAYDGDTDAYFRWSPAGGAVGDKRYTSSKGRITKLPNPSGKQEDSTPVQITVELTCASVAEDTVT